MKALILEAYNRLAYRNVPDPQIGPGEVLVQVKACGICGSDVHGMDGRSGRRIPPVIMGHEAAGIIAEVGAEVAGWQPGERVTFDSTLYCGQCHFCRRGLINLCDRRRVLGVSCEDYCQDGAFAQYVAVPQHVLYRLPEGVTFVQAAMAEPLSVALHAVGRMPITLNDSAIVVGAGMIGLLIVQALRAAGCGRIVAVDLDPARLALARELGAEVALRAGQGDGVEDSLVAEIRRLTGGHGADLAFEVVGLTPTLELATRCVRKGGALALVGNLASRPDFMLQSVVTRQLTLYGCCASCGEYPASLEMMARGVIDVEALISAVAPLEKGADWFGQLYRGEPGLMKVILQP